MSVIVFYEGNKKVIKVPSHNTLIMELIADAAAHFQLDATTINFKHKSSIVDSSLPFRFSNLSNNSQVEIVLSTKQPSGGRQTCRIAVAAMIEGKSTTIQETFVSACTLKDMLTEFAKNKKLPLNILEMNPELVYLRTAYHGDKLNETSLASLGLTGYVNKTLLLMCSFYLYIRLICITCNTPIL
jgi:hypothetical protein